MLDLGTNSKEPSDYPDHAKADGLAVLEGRAERGILICGSCVGASIAANKLPEIRAAVRQTRIPHTRARDEMNVPVLGARTVGRKLAEELVRTFLASRFGGGAPSASIGKSQRTGGSLLDHPKER